VDSLTSPGGGLAGLALASFLAATLVPLPSEAALYAYLRLHPESAALAVAVATLANTAGGMTTYLIGRLVPERTHKRLEPRALAWLKRFGAPATLLAWLPVAGDALCLATGWLRVHWLAALGFMAAGRLARYLAVAAL
jgi:membrane protein YqaA with SNARE-associated domain